MYLDPPYLLGTRTARRGYRYELEDEDHERLLKLIQQSQSMFVISDYDSDLYNDTLDQKVRSCQSREKQTTR